MTVVIRFPRHERAKVPVIYVFRPGGSLPYRSRKASARSLSTGLTR